MPIEVKNLTHIYMSGTPYETLAIDDISFTIHDGEFVGIIGHTGSGKSTLIQHMNALLKPTTGTVTVDGQDINVSGPSLKNLRFKVGLVFQYPEYQLFEETVRRDIAFGPRNLGLDDDEAEERVLWASSLVGIGKELLDKSPFELSGGQKRRVAIAGVLAMKPSTLILDEPAAGLDPGGRRAMYDLLKELHSAGNMTMVMVSHSMADVASLCTRILVINKGKLAMDGTPTEVFLRSEELNSMSLGVPEAAILAQKLRDKGFGIPSDIWSIKWLARSIKEELKGAEKDG